MSHFTVLVIGEDPEKQLAPYHEYECTGIDDEYVQNVDVTEEKREDYESGSTSRMKDKDGDLFKTYDDQFYREPTEEEKEDHPHMGGFGCGGGISWTSKDWGDGRGYRAKVGFVPDGFEEVELSFSEVMTFEEYLSDYEEISSVGPCSREFWKEFREKNKYGYCVLDKDGKVKKIINRTNPNAKWDWWALGGRWSGHFKVKDEAKGFINLREKPGYADSARKGDIDFEGMMKEAYDKAVSNYDKIAGLCGGEIPKLELSWADLIKEKGITEAREIYNSHESVKLFKEATSDNWLDLEDFQCTREEYGQDASKKAISTFAVVKDSKWYEKGEMGWWASVSNEKEQLEWNAEFEKLIGDLPDDTLLSVCDCHI